MNTDKHGLKTKICVYVYRFMQFANSFHEPSLTTKRPKSGYFGSSIELSVTCRVQTQPHPPCPRVTCSAVTPRQAGEGEERSKKSPLRVWRGGANKFALGVRLSENKAQNGLT